MDLIKSKNKKLEERLRKVDYKIPGYVQQRYLRFCRDQHIFTLLQWRNKVSSLNLSKKESTMFGVKSAFKIVEHPITLRGAEGQVIHNKEHLGPQVSQLPAVLGGQSGARVVLDSRELQAIEKAESISDLIDCFPKQHIFYPNDEIIHQMIMFTLNVKNEEQLWEGFVKHGKTWN